jgi:hypothetical protein
MYAKNKEGKIATKFLIRLRLYDHDYSERHNVKLEKEFVKKKVQEYKRPKEKKLQKWVLKQIIINGDYYHDYYEAYDAIEQELEEYSKKMFNKGD